MQEEQPQEQSPLLEYEHLFRRWQGEITPPNSGPILVWMDNATFQRYVDAYLVARCKGEPTPEDRRDAIASLRRVSYWLTMQVADEAVHIRRFGRRPLPEEERYAQ